MSDGLIISEISRITLDLNIKEGEPPEDAIRLVMEDLLCSLGRAAKNYSSKEYLFPMVFPMELTLSSEVVKYSFRIVARLKSTPSEHE